MDKQNNINNEQNEITEERSAAMIEMMVGRGLIGDQKIDSEKIRQAQQEKKKKSFQNTMLLLTHYRNIAWMLECFPDTIAEELDKPFENLDALISSVDVEMAWGNRKLESRLESIKKSRILIDRVNEALTVLKKKPDNGSQLYDLIYLTYISPEKLSHTEILYRLNMSSRHYYRLRDQAVTIISIRLWSAPDTDVSCWLDMITILEGLNG